MTCLFILEKVGREREGEKHQCEREISIGCLLFAPNQMNPQPRHVPSLGIKPRTFWLLDYTPAKWVTLARAHGCFNLHFLDDIWGGISLHLLVWNLYIFFGEVSVKTFGWFLNQVVYYCFFGSFLLFFGQEYSNEIHPETLHVWKYFSVVSTEKQYIGWIQKYCRCYPNIIP